MFSGTSINVVGFSRIGDIMMSSSVGSFMPLSTVALLGVSEGTGHRVVLLSVSRGSFGVIVFLTASSLSCKYGLSVYRRGFSENSKGRKILFCVVIEGPVDLDLLSSVFFSSPIGEVCVALNFDAK